LNAVFKSILVIGALAWPTFAAAQNYPTKSVRMIIPQQPGSSSDILGRYVADALSKLWGQSVVIENRPGGSTLIGTRHVGQATPDGYTLLFSSSTISGTAAVTPDFDFAKELAPIAVVATGDMVIITGTRIPLPNVKELVAKAKAGKLFMASSGTGSTGEVALLSLSNAADIKMETVMYKSPPEALIDLVGGRVDVFTTSTTTYLASDAANKTTPVAVSSRKRAKQLPNVPTVIEAGYAGVVVEPWWALLAPAKTPPEILNKLNQDVNTVMAKPEAAAFLEKSQNSPEKMSVKESTDYIVGDIDKAKQLIAKQGLYAK
jgi:tripartite-type tricarboxylate transporter receptor subunit TctC